MSTKLKQKKVTNVSEKPKKESFIEKVGNKIPAPVIIFTLI